MTSETLSLMYGIDLPARCLTGVPMEQDRTLFLVGTLALRQENQHISGSGKLQCGVTLWQMNAEDTTLAELARYQAENSERCFSCDIHPEGGKAAFAANKTLHITDVEASLKVLDSAVMESKSCINSVMWNPHFNGSNVAVAYGDNVKGIDIRGLDQAFLIKSVNSPCVRNMDFNPNVQYTLATCGDDCRVILWDIRDTTRPLKVLQDHSHWVWSVRFNPIHDQLILSAGSDARLFLNSVESLSSESVQSLALMADDSDTSGQENKLGDERLEEVEEHEDSIYSCAWAGNDPWIFASVSFDGRVIVSRVKRHHKYAILRL